MTQQIVRNGKTYRFPDEASLDQINNFFHDEFKSNLSSSIKSMLPTIPHGLNVATGMMSLAFPGEQAELVKNLPQVMTRTQPSTSQKIEQFAGEMLPGMEVGPQAAVKAAKGVGKGIEYIQPQKEIPKLMEKLGGGAKTSEENIANLSSEVSRGRIAQEEEALVPKREFLEGTKGKNIYKKEPSEVGKFMPSKYLESGQSTKGYSQGLKQTHNNFMNDRNPDNADKLMSGIKREMRRIKDTANKVGWTNTSENTYKKLSKNLDNLTSDFTQFINELPPELRGKYKDFTNKWKINAAPYGADKTIEALSEGKHLGLTQSQIAKAFANPTKETIKILGDIGEPGKGHVLYNFLQNIDPKNVSKFAKAILDAKKTKGYSQYVTPELEAWANNIIRRQSTRSATQDIALGLATLPLMGPMGAASVIGAKHAMPYLGTAFKRMIGK